MKKIISIIITISILLISVPAFAISGVGTESNPYLISSASDITKIHDDLDGYYKLTTDIDMSGVDFEPIGNENDGAFTGTIDGDGYTIRNLNINLPANKYVGFVGYLEGTIENLNFVNIDAYGYRYVGGIAGYASSTSRIINSSVSGKVGGTYEIINIKVGGIVGNCSGELKNVTNYASVSVTNSNTTFAYCGGVVGMLDGTMENCFNKGEVSSNSAYVYLGGIGGYSSSSICNCINYGIIFSNGYTGGILGYSSGNISKCVNYNKVSSEYDGYDDRGAGGIAGIAYKDVSNCINYGEINSKDYTGGIVGINNDNVISCVNYGNVFGSYAGGIIGCTVGNSSTPGIVKNCLNLKGAMVGWATTGGDLGTRRYVEVSESINLGINSDIIKSSFNNYCREINNVYTLKQLSVTGDIPYENQLNIVDLKNKQNFNEFDFEKTWEIKNDINSGFPILIDLPNHIVLNECVKIMAVGDICNLFAYLGNTTENVTWESDDESIATVSSNGCVSAKKNGYCTITATNSLGMKAICLIYVQCVAESINLNKQYVTIESGKTEKLSCTLNSNESNETVWWYSDDTTVATVSQKGVVTAKNIGCANIYSVTTDSNLTSSCMVEVVGSPITGISISSSYRTKTVNVGEVYKIPFTISPSQYSGEIYYTSSHPEVAVVSDSGEITAKTNGTTIITAKSDTGYSATCTITVKAPATSITLNKNELTLEVGYTEKLTAVMLPTNTTDTVSWSTSSSTYVSVATDGTITAKKVGTATITASTSSGQKAYCIVKVVNPVVPVASVTLDKTEHIMTKSETVQLKGTVLPSDSTNKELTWSTSDDSVASVNDNGVVTANSVGVAIITATANNGMYHECIIKVVSASGPSIVLTPENAIPNAISKVKASIVKNPGISGYKFTVNYDETLLTPVAVTPNGEFGGSLSTNLDDDDRVGLNIVWYADENVDVSGELFTIDFKVSDSAEYGDTSSISIEYGAKDICNTAGEYFALYMDDATISIEEPIPGDIYEDGEVTIYDLTLLSRYITSLETFTERQKEAADVNNDDLVNVLDVIKMAQYLTGWSGVQLMSLDLFSLDEPVAPVISVGSASVNAANEAEIPVYIKGNTGIAAYKFILDYNAEDIEILSITPSELIKENFKHNLGVESQAEDGLIVTSHTSGGNMTEEGVLFTIKVRYKNPTDVSVSPISIVDNFDNMGNENAAYVTATYETGYALGSDYIVANKVVGDTNFSCELYFDDSYAEQSAKAIIAFYDGDGRMVQLMPKDITVKPGKVDLSIDYDKKAYATYKLMIWEGMNSLKPITNVK